MTDTAATTETESMKTVTKQRAAADRAIEYRAAWCRQHEGPITGSIKILVEKLERFAGPVAVEASFQAWAARQA